MCRFCEASAAYISGCPLYVSASTSVGTMYEIMPYCIASA